MKLNSQVRKFHLNIFFLAINLWRVYYVFSYTRTLRTAQQFQFYLSWSCYNPLNFSTYALRYIKKLYNFRKYKKNKKTNYNMKQQ